MSWRERLSAALIRLRATGSDRFQRLLRPGARTSGAVVVVYGGGAIAKANDWPRPSIWAPGTTWNTLLVIAGALAATGYFLVTIGYSRALRKSSENARLEKVCRGVVQALEDHTRLKRDEVGVHVWAVRGVKGIQHLQRRARLVPRDRTVTSITWRKGMGVIGQCWARDETLIVDLSELERQAVTPEAFYAIPREDRFLFSWRDFQETRKYKAILAVPLRTGPTGARRFRGCLSVDVRVDGKAQELDTLVKTDAFDDVRSVCEAVLGGT